MHELHLIAGTGRVGTSFIAKNLNEIEAVAALHEGHLGDDNGPDVLPMINVQHFGAYKSYEQATNLVQQNRNQEIIDSASTSLNVQTIIDVAYYNAIIARPLLELLPTSRMVAIVRDCESFVRSATWLSGEDPMPVGWPEPGKTLSQREKFISLGRIRPISGSAADSWAKWGAIERNIWLWRETNSILLTTVLDFRERSLLLSFDDFVSNTNAVLVDIAKHLVPELVEAQLTSSSWPQKFSAHDNKKNERSGGYQIGDSTTWSPRQQELLDEANNSILEKMETINGLN